MLGCLRSRLEPENPDSHNAMLLPALDTMHGSADRDKDLQTAAGVMNEVCACLHREAWTGADYAQHPADIAYTIRHWVQRGLHSADIVEVLRKGGTIEQPPLKKRGRKPKNQKGASAQSIEDAGSTS